MNLATIPVQPVLQLRYGGPKNKGVVVADSNHERRTVRVALSADIDVRRPGDHRYRAPLMDLSPDGCRVEVPVNVDPGDLLFISLPGIETIEGRVRWVKDWTAGVEFEKPLHAAVFDMIRNRMNPR